MAKPLKVLVVEDSEDDALLLVRELETAGYAPEWRRVETERDFIEALEVQDWEIVVSDHSMPAFTAVSAIEILKARKLTVPVVILSGTIGETAAVAAMRAGAGDYVMKGETARLIPAIERELREAAERRKARLVERQLLQAQKMEAVGRLAGGIAHDFNNLLTAILGAASFLLDTMDPEDPKRRDASDIKEAGERAAALTRQLLVFSRARAVEPKVIDLSAVVAGVERLLRRVIGEDVELVVRPGAGLGSVKADPGQVEQILMNLAVNARDAMPDGGTLTIEAAGADRLPGSGPGEADEDGEFVVLSVADTGTGMDEETLARAYEPFFTTKEPGKGTGLGLSTVFGIVKQSGGRILVESAPGKGTAFRIFFRRDDSAAEPGPAAARPRRRAGTGRILAVEDDDRIRKLLKRALEAAGYGVLAAEGPLEALRVLKNPDERFDLLATDVVMPQMSGIDLSRRARELRPGLKVLFLSGYTDRELGREGVAERRSGFLQKPFTPEELAAKVREVLDG